MKNTTILLLFLCCMYPVYMQAQTEFSQTGTQWKTKRFCYGTISNVYVNIDYLYELGGDTLLGDKHCKKLYQDKKVVGAFLEEDRKVWYYPFQEYADVPEKVLLYDFSKEKGDKIESYRIPWNIGGDLSYCSYFDKPVTLTVENVYYEYGRKVMEVSSDYYYDREDIWIEGIGSPSSFWGAYEMATTDGVNRNTSLVQVLAQDKSVLFYNGQPIDPDYQSTFLKPGKTWEIQNPKNNIDKITIGNPQLINNYPSYPVYLNGAFRHGYLYDVNGTICWIFDSNDGTLDLDHFLYDFNYSVGDRIYLCTYLERTAVYYAPPEYEAYKVTHVDKMQCMGKSLKRIVLEGGIKHVWLEDVGSLNLLLYLDNSGYHLDAPQYKLLRCYTGDEMIYDCSDFPDGIEEAVLSVPTYSIIDNQLIVKDGDGYRLSLYDPFGVEVYNQALSDMEESIPLPVHPATMLIGRLQKGDIVVSFKIGEAGK